MAQNVASDHSDYIHDIAYDYYGKRIATCSSDQHIKIWTQTPDLKWIMQADWKAHYGPVWRVTWAHPEFGQVLASCSFDHNVLIWEEQEGVDDKGRVISRWHKRAQLGDARDSINDIKFAPRHLGLKIAAGSADGYVRVYAVMDSTSLAHWQCGEEFEAEPASSGGVACLAWTTSAFELPLLVVGGGSTVKIWRNSDGRRWTPLYEFLGHSARVHDVAWAPNIGRSYHLIATAGGDGKVGLWKLQTEDDERTRETAPASSIVSGGSTWRVSAFGASKGFAVPIEAFDDHSNLPVWRVEFNMTGTVLASSGDDGSLRLRRQNIRGKWETVAAIDTHAGLMAAEESRSLPAADTMKAPASPPLPAWAHAAPTSLEALPGLAPSGFKLGANTAAITAAAGAASGVSKGGSRSIFSLSTA